MGIRPSARKRKIRFLLVVFIAGICIFFGLNRLVNSQSPKIVSPLVAGVRTAQLPVVQNQVVGGGLKEVVEKALEGTKGSYGIVVHHFKTGETYYANEHRVYEPASLYKLWVMATVFEEIQSGKLTEDEVLSEEVAILNDKFKISSEAAELTEGKVSMSVSEALDKMITISHNYAALLLAQKVRNSSIKEFLQNHNFTESGLGEPPRTTPYDIALFLEKLYKGELANPEYTQKMIGFLKRQRLNHKISKYLPQGVSIAHKTGELGWFTHDAGIIYSPKGDYVLVLLSESVSPPGAEERLALVSKGVYEYFMRD